MDEVFVQVGQDTRRNARMSPDRLLEEMRLERESLKQEKQDVEFKLTQVEDWKREELSRILMRRMDKSRSIEATALLEAEVRKKKAPLIKEKQAIEKRLHDIKSKFIRQPPNSREELQVLLRIEKLLLELVEQSKRK